MPQSEIITIGAGRTLSRRKARKLANRYRGSSRGQRYAEFLAGKQSGFYVQHNRLRRIPKTGRVSIQMVHTQGALLAIQKATTGLSSYSIESPPEFRLAD